MPVTRLRFPTLFALLFFRTIVKARVEKTSLRHCSLHCRCTQEELELAVRLYGASISVLPEFI